jgi:large repetitive protein
MAVDTGSRTRARVAVLVATVLSATCVIAVPAARALNVCSAGCTVVANEDDYTVTYNPAGTKFSVNGANGVLANDAGPSTTVVDLQDTPDEPGTYAVTTWQGFTVTINNYGAFTYKADPSFSGVDSFDYYIWDSHHHDNFDFNTVYITVVPVVTNDAYGIVAGRTLNVAEPGVTGNDAGVDPTLLVFDSLSANGGTITDNGGGAFAYTPPPHFSGTDTFSYDIWDLNTDNDYTGVVTVYVFGAATTTPDPPTGAVAIAGNGSASVAFSPPASDGGAAITGYAATCGSADGGATGNTSGAASPLVVTGLTNGHTYTCTITATNSVGTSAPSEASNAFVPATVPDLPTGAVATAGNSSASVAFSAPASDGGAAITGYTASCTSSTGGATGSTSGPASPLVVTGLTNGDTYTCTVTATNAVGGSDPSAPSNPLAPAGCTSACVSVGDQAMLEGDAGTHTMTLPVTLSTPSVTSVSVQYTVRGSTATGGTKSAPGVDFLLKSGTVTFKPSTTTGKTPTKLNLDVTIYADTNPEPDETFSVILSNPVGGYAVGRNLGTGTILNDDDVASGITIGIADSSIVSAMSGNQSLNIPVALSRAAATQVSVQYTVTAASASYSTKAAGGGDFGGKLTGTIGFAAGTKKLTISIPVWPDANSEPDETFTITLSGLVGAGVTMLRSFSTQTILGGF